MSTSSVTFEIVPAAKAADLASLRPVLESAICNPFTQEPILDEVEDVLANVQNSAGEPGERFYAVAQTSGGVALGVMGLQVPENTMSPYVNTPNPVEITNAYVSSQARGMHIGQSLVTYLEDVARKQGRTEIVLNSGPRYALTGWGFWRKTYGEPIATAKDYYGPGYHAEVWRKLLEPAETP
jgi:ribosomal protein S18 acetylase RimI-like enzyme